MIQIEYNRTQNSTLVKCDNLQSINHLLPLKVDFVNIVSGEIHYTSELSSHSWCQWTGGELLTDVLVYSKDGILLQEYKWQVWEKGDPIEKSLWYYLINRKQQNIPSNGLVIGTHDGRNGHWLYPVIHNVTKATLIDGSTMQFKQLEKYYSKYNNARLINTIVTTHGQDVTWYHGGEGYQDTIVEDLISDWVPKDQIIKEHRRSIAINVLMQEGGYDWLHLDAEGIDDQLIFSLNKLPNIIIYESLNFEPERTQKIHQFFDRIKYGYLEHNGNTIAYKL